MPPPLEASQTFSFQVPTMPSSESGTALRKQEIGRPRVGAAIRQDRRRRHEPQPRHLVVEPLRMRRRRRHRRRRRARTCPESSRRQQIAVASASPCRNRSAGRRALRSSVRSAGCGGGASGAGRGAGRGADVRRRRRHRLDDSPRRPCGSWFGMTTQIAALIEVVGERRHRSTPRCWGGGRRRTCWRPAARTAAGCKRPTGTPRPRTFSRSRQVSWLAGRCGCRVFPVLLRTSDT